MRASWSPWLVGLLLGPVPSPQIYRFEVSVRTVYVDVFVTEQGQSVTGLSANDFEVLDNGVPQTVALIDPRSLPLSALLVLDTSESVTGEKLEDLRSAAHGFAAALQEKDETGLLTFTHMWTLRKDLDDDRDRLRQALDQPIETGLTALYDALYAGLKFLEDASGRPMLLVFTDGLDNASWLTEEDVLEVARRAGPVVHVVAIRSSLEAAGSRNADSGRFLRNLTRATGGRLWFADTSANLGEVLHSVLVEMRNRYILSYQLPEPIEAGWHKLTVRLKKGRRGEVRARGGYAVSPD